ncbi:hypothetical protein COO60DRAFT_701982 [Scenedesmus sp. NREL 46B-D3]|nr:hypothetical protein COO60DRAFT_701982 [Scenedesmus sp. NREL 46B-D3]
MFDSQTRPSSLPWSIPKLGHHHHHVAQSRPSDDATKSEQAAASRQSAVLQQSVLAITSKQTLALPHSCLLHSCRSKRGSCTGLQTGSNCSTYCIAKPTNSMKQQLTGICTHMTLLHVGRLFNKLIMGASSQVQQPTKVGRGTTNRGLLQHGKHVTLLYGDHLCILPKKHVSQFMPMSQPSARTTCFHRLCACTHSCRGAVLAAGCHSYLLQLCHCFASVVTSQCCCCCCCCCRLQEPFCCISLQLWVAQCCLRHLGILVYALHQRLQGREVCFWPHIATHHQADFLAIKGLQQGTGYSRQGFITQKQRLAGYSRQGLATRTGSVLQ